MAEPVINSITAVQGTGAITKQSVIQLTVNFTASNNCNFAGSISLDGGDTWNNAVLHSAANGQNVAASTSATVLVDIDATFKQPSFPARGVFAATRIRLQATDPVQSLNSTLQSTSNFTIKSTLPVITGATMPQYIGSTNANAAALSVFSHNGDGSTAPTMVRLNLSVSELDAGTVLPFEAYNSGNLVFPFPGSATNGQQTVFIRVYDGFYNASTVGSAETWLQRTPPTGCSVRIIGMQGNENYTGIKINDDGSFTPNRNATLQLTGYSPLALNYTILPGSNVENADNINVSTPLGPETATPAVKLTTNAANPTADNYNRDATVLVSVAFTDAAGNQAIANAAIRLNTRIYKTAHTPLRLSDSIYRPLLRHVTSGGAEVTIPKALILTGEPYRLWDDIFYPESHAYPMEGDGTVDEAEAIAMAQSSNENHDALLLSGGQVVYDEEQRPVVVDWTDDGSKNYGHMISSTPENRKYWAIDTTGYGEYSLSFEHFNVDSNTYGPPYNEAAPHRGDVLVVYDATASGALQESLDEFGQQKWILGDTTKLKEIHAFTGSGTNVLDLTSGQRMNSSPNGAFQTPPIRGIPKIVLIFFSDALESDSGFRLRSSPAYDRTWVNYDVDEANGELWIHMHTTLGSAPGAADTTAKRMTYDWLENPITIDYDQGRVIFPVPPSGVVDVDVSYHDWNGGAPSNLWITAQDDFVDYAEAAIHSQNPTASGVSLSPTSADRLKIHELDGWGRVTSGFVWDTDRGIVQIDDDKLPPSGQRYFADYQYHTYHRLSSDGYGDMTWRDSIIVADDTPLYPDYTYTDLKIVNEGGAPLEDGRLKFVPRGYDTNNDGQVSLETTGTPDQVLNINRPWDIQRGTAQETYERMAVEVNDSYIWNRSMAKAAASTVLAQWKNRVFGDIPARSRVYGRAVWVLGGTSGSAYPPTTAGPKRCSIEVGGKYYASLVL